jgi:uncharacterized SAM-binding protein YcdF (DUF218 family)
MFFYFSRIVWFFFQPSSALLVVALIGAALLYTRWWRSGRFIVVAAILVLAIAGLSPLGQALILPLEERFSPLADNAPAPDGIIVLGGAFDTLVSPARGVAALNEAAERLTSLVSLARRYPQAKLVFSGGAAQLFYAGAREADLARDMLGEAGLDPERLILEGRSRNTFQNALMTKGILRPKASERWLLVTSAYHMPRAIGSFRRVGFPVTAYPVDYRTRGPADLLRPFDKVSEGLRRVDIASREWVGLAVYRLTGRSSALFPAP